MIDDSQIRALIDAIGLRVRQELRARCEEYKPDFQTPEVFSVLTALLSRQATLAIEISSAPQLWNGHSAPLFLRAMTDVHITLSWILLDVRARSRLYIDHGLGQAVLALEHRKKEMESVDVNSKKMLEELINAEERPCKCQHRSMVRQDHQANG
jgi:hypothetical protein